MKIKINNDLYQNADELFRSLGYDIEKAINIFLEKSLEKGGFPFDMEVAQVSPDSVVGNELTDADLINLLENFDI